MKFLFDCSINEVCHFHQFSPMDQASSYTGIRFAQFFEIVSVIKAGLCNCPSLLDPPSL